MKKICVVLLACSLFACSDDATTDQGSDTGVDRNDTPDVSFAEDDGNVVEDMGSVADTAVEVDQGMAEECAPRPDDAPRFLVVSRPNDADLNPRNLYEVLTVEDDGSITSNGVEFTMGRAQMGRIVFSQNGRVGMAVQEDGSIGVFTLEDDGTPTVVNANFTGDDFYAGTVVPGPSPDTAYVLHLGFRDLENNNLGGVYRVSIDCKTGELTDEGLVGGAKLAYEMDFLSDGRAVLASDDFLEDMTRNDVHLIDLQTPSRLNSAQIFPDDDAIISHMAVTHDDQFALLTDNSLFGTHRIGVARIDGDSISGAQVITDVEDPASVVTSPYDNAVVVVLGEGNALQVYDYDSSAAEPLSFRESLNASLPEYTTTIDRGPLMGNVYISQVGGIRRLQFMMDGTIEDHGVTQVAEGVDGSIGALGVQ